MEPPQRPRRGRIARQQARKRRRERVAGALLAGLGVVVLIVALFALRNPNHGGTAPGSATRTITETVPLTPVSSSSRASSSPSPPRSSGSTSRSASSSSSSASPGLTGALPLIVLNNTTRANLASAVGDDFKVGGWTVTSVDEDYSNNIASSAAYYDPSVSNAQAVATQLRKQFPAIKRVVPKFSPLPSGPIIVILDDDWPSS